jgi:hypothetical protein
MLHAAAVEAVAERTADSMSARPATADDVTKIFKDAESGTARKKPDAGKARGYSFETEENVLFETRSTASDDWVHRSYLKK